MNSKTLIGAVIAAILAIAVYYGLLSRQSADNLQNQANQTLGTTPPSQPAPQQTVPPSPQSTTQAPAPAPAGPVPQSPPPAAKQ